MNPAITKSFFLISNLFYFARNHFIIPYREDSGLLIDFAPQDYMLFFRLAYDYLQAF
jgi:hypothetical protein